MGTFSVGYQQQFPTTPVVTDVTELESSEDDEDFHAGAEEPVRESPIDAEVAATEPAHAAVRVVVTCNGERCPAQELTDDAPLKIPFGQVSLDVSSIDRDRLSMRSEFSLLEQFACDILISPPAPAVWTFQGTNMILKSAV